MKLSMTTLGCPQWSIEKIAEEFSALGIPGIEIRGIEGVMELGKIPCLSAEGWPRTKALLDKKGLEIMCLGTSANFHDPLTCEKGISEAKEAIDIAHRIGTDAIRVFGNNLPKDPAEEAETIQRVVSALKEVCAYASGKNVMVCLETHGDFNTVERLSAVIEGMKDAPEFRIVWDVMHTDRIYQDNFMPVYELMRPYIHHLHVKDYRGDGELVLCGEGRVPLKAIVDALKKDGYEGYLSFEWEKVWHPEIPDAEIAFPQFAAYFGKLLG